MRAAYSVAFVVSGSMLFLVVVLVVFGVRQPGHHAPLQTARSSVEELREDVSEVEAFAEASRRSGVNASDSSRSIEVGQPRASEPLVQQKRRVEESNNSTKSKLR
eukprot:768027-Hanusia_phi.AAC.9